MNKLFGFFKQKLTQASIQNKKDLQSFVSILTQNDDTGYKSQVILGQLQKIKTNYMTYNILIANEASTGLYYSQLHNHSVCLRKVQEAREKEKEMERLKIVKGQMEKTHEELKEVAGLSENWVQGVSQSIQKIKLLRQRKLGEKSQKNIIGTIEAQNQALTQVTQNNVQKPANESSFQSQQPTAIILSRQPSPVIISSNQPSDSFPSQKW